MRQRGGGMVPRRVLAALLLLCLAGVVGILLLCLPTTDLRQPPGFKIPNAKSSLLEHLDGASKASWKAIAALELMSTRVDVSTAESVFFS